MKRQRKYKGFKLNHNGSPSHSNNPQGTNQAFFRKIQVVKKTIGSIHIGIWGQPLTEASYENLRLLLSKGVREAIEVGASTVRILNFGLIFYIEVPWFKAGADEKTALKAITFDPITQETKNLAKKAVANGFSKVGGAA